MNFENKINVGLAVPLTIYIVCILVTLFLGVYLVKLANTDLKTHQCRSESWIKAIGVILVIIALLKCCVLGGMYWKMK